jgi:acyl-CoA thioesterase YciA
LELISTHICKTQNIGFHGNLFGGIMLSWLDEAGAAFAAQVCGTPRVVTKSISEVVFEKPVRPGQIIKIYGNVLKIGVSSLTIKLEARRHSVYNGSQKKVCSIDTVFVRIDGDGEPVPIRTIKKEYRDKRPKEVESTINSKK